MNVSGLEELLLFPFTDKKRKIEVLTNYLLNLDSYGFPYWSHEYAKYRVDFLIPLIATDEEISKETSELLEFIFTNIPEISIANESILLEYLPNYLNYHWSNLFLTSALSSLINGFILEEIEWETYHKYVKKEWALNWFSNSNLGVVEAILRKNCNSYNSWKKCWAFLANLPEVFFVEFQFVFPPWINILIYERQYSWDWTELEVNYWCQIIRNLSNPFNDIHFQLCSFALDYSFRNCEFPFSKLVVETFWTVYKVILETGKDDLFSNNQFNILSWLNWDWDKALSLRKKIVQSYLSSSWPPGDIAIGIPDNKTLRKIIKRILDKQNGKQYVKEILFDLSKREDSESQNRYKYLSNLLRNNEIHEPWY